MIDTQELIARLEAATGPDRELDAEIALAIGIVRDRDGDCFFGHRYYSVMVLERGYYDIEGGAPELPHYTASIDAALTMMPELWNYVIGSPGIEETKLDKWCVNIAMHPDDRGDLTFAPTPALAICIAALKARSQTDD
jgi:hypothetical protein